jgi:predicted Zn-dependent protease
VLGFPAKAAPDMTRSRALVGLLALAGCVFGTTVADERKEGRAIARDVEALIGLYPSPAQKWASSVGMRLVSRLGSRDQDRWDFAFDVVDQVEPNAFAIPGGHVYVSRGLLALITTEDELACVLGHEITHVTERHSTARARKAVLPGILTLPGRLVGVVNTDLGNLVAAPFEALGDLRLAHYSRSQEAEADSQGAKLAARAGYDPRALATILERLEKDATRLMGKEHKPSFFDDHPDTPTRVKDVESEAAELTWVKEPPLERWPEILATLDGLPWGENPAVGVFRENRFLHPDLGFAVEFPAGWRTVNTPSFAGATRGENAVVVISVTGSSDDPAKQGRAFAARLRDQDVTPDEELPLVVNGYPAYLVRVSEARSDVRAYLVWVRMGGLTYRFLALGPDRERPVLWATIESLRPINDLERRSIEVVRLRSVVTEKAGTIADATETSGNVWPADYTAMVNGVREDLVLAAGVPVKIARREPYAGPER